MLKNKNYWDIDRTNQVHHDAATRAAADAPNRWPQPSFQPIARRSIWADMHGHPWMASLSLWGGCGCCCRSIRVHASRRSQTELPRPPKSPDRHRRTTGECVSSSSFDRHLTGRVFKSTHRPKAWKSATEVPCGATWGKKEEEKRKRKKEKKIKSSLSLALFIQGSGPGQHNC